MEEDKHIITPAKKNIFKDLSSLKQKAKESVKSTFYSVPLPPSEAPASAQKSKPLFSKEKNEKIVTFWLASMLIVVMGIGIFFSFKAQQSNQKQKGLSLKKPTTSPAKPPITLALSPTPNLATDWKTFTSSQLNISFKYPPAFRVSENYKKGTGLVDNGILVDLEQTEGDPPRRFDITNSTKDDFWSVARSDKVYSINVGETYIAPENENINLTRLQDQEINGINWHVYEDNDPWELPTPLRYLITNNKGVYYIIRMTYSNPGNVPTTAPWYGVDYVSLFDQILSTFRFLE